MTRRFFSMRRLLALSWPRPKVARNLPALQSGQHSSCKYTARYAEGRIGAIKFCSQVAEELQAVRLQIPARALLLLVQQSLKLQRT